MKKKYKEEKGQLMQKSWQNSSETQKLKEKKPSKEKQT